MEIDRRAIVRSWKDADRDSVAFLLVSDVETSRLLPAVDAAVLASNAYLQRNRTDRGTDFSCTEPWPAPGGVAFHALVADTAEALDEWTDAFARELDAAGVDGRLTADRGNRPKIYSTHHLALSAVLSLEGWTPFEIGRAWTGWFEDPALGARVFDWAVDWVADGVDALHLGLGLTMFARPREVVRRILPSADRPGTQPKVVNSPSVDRVRLVVLDECGRLVVQLRDDRRSWQELVGELQDVLTLFADVTECALVRWGPAAVADAAGIIATQRPPQLPTDDTGQRAAGYYRGGRHLDTEYLPDAYGMQVVGAGHLSRTRDLSDWSVSEIAPSKHLVVARDLVPWFAGTEPSAQVVERARADFGDAVLRGEPPRQPGRRDG